MIFTNLANYLALYITRIGGKGMLTLFAGYCGVSYLAVWLSGEPELTRMSVFWYWLAATASTVGYGDYSPTTVAGRILTSIWIMPAGISMFAVVLTKVGIAARETIVKHYKGFGMTNHKGHTAVIGWNGHRTVRLLNLLIDESENHDTQIELYVTKDIENPMPKRVDMIRVESFTDKDDMYRGSIYDAARIIIDTESDDITVTTSLFCANHAPEAHKTVYLKDESTSELLQQHCPNVEVVPDVSVEMLAKATLDKGSSSLHKELLDASEGETQYSHFVDCDSKQTYFDVFAELKKNHAATLIALKKSGSENITVNAKPSEEIVQGDRLYYIADNRLKSEVVNDLLTS